MAFKSQQNLSLSPQPIENTGTDIFSWEAPSLNRIRKKSPEKADVSEADARNNAIRTLNALTVFSPLICVIGEKLSNTISAEQASQEFKEMLSMVDVVSESIGKSFQLDLSSAQNTWIKNAVQSIISNAFKESTQRRKVFPHDFFTEQATTLLNLVEIERWTQYDIGYSLSNQAHLQITTLSVASKITSKLLISFDFFYNHDKILPEIVQKLTKRGTELVAQIAESHTAEKDRIAMYAQTMDSITDVFCACWIQQAKKALKDLEKLTEKDIQHKIKPLGGLPLDDVWASFDTQTNRLLGVVLKVAPPKKSIAKEMVKPAPN